MQEICSFDYAIGLNRYGMKLLGFWPLDTRLFYHFQCGFIFTIIFAFMFPAVGQWSTVKGWNPILHQALYTIPIIPLLARFVFMKVMSGNFRVVLRTMIIDWASYRYLSQRDQRIMVHYARRGRRFNIFSLVLMMMSIIGYILTPVVNTWLNDLPWNATTKTLPHEGIYPFRYEESPVFEILYVVQTWFGFLAAMAIISVDCFLYIIVFHACGQFDLLDTALKRYDNLMKHDYTKDTRSRTCACLACIVKQHTRILNYMDIVEKSFRDFVLLQLLGYWFNLVFQGRELVMYVQERNFNGIVTCVMYVLNIMFNIFIYCYVGECIIEKSEKIGRTAHNLEWQRFPRDSNLPIIVARSRIPCKITAGKFITMSISYYTTILVTTISYISFLEALT